MEKFKVLRHHQGDRDYRPGDTRDATLADVAHLVSLGVLEPTSGDERKAEDVPANKAERPVSNKARRGATKNK